MPQYHIVTLGETMLRLTPRDFKRIEQATAFEIVVGGTESNMAVGLARLGMRVAWLSRLTDSSLGRLIANTLRGYGVDTRHVVWTDQDRVGLYFLDEGPPPRGTAVIYDRAASAISRMMPDELPAHLFTPETATQLHLTGITLAIGEPAAATAARALELARAANWRISFDLNYRGKLWSPAAARAGCHAYAAAADIFILPLRDAQLIYDLPTAYSPEETIFAIAELYPQADLVMTLGAEGAIALPHGVRTPLHQPAFLAEGSGAGRIGGGDAFNAGFFYGYEHFPEDRIAQGLLWGAAAAAIKYTIPGDLPVIDKEMVAALVESGGKSGGVRR